MPDLGSVAHLPSWHPPSEVLEFAELVLSGVLDAAPIAIPVPPEVIGVGHEVVIEDAEGTPVAVLHQPAERQPPRFSELRSFSHGPVRSARRSPADVRAELAADPATAGRALAVPVTTALSTEQVNAVLAQAARSGRPLLWLAVVGTGRSSGLPPAAFWRAVRGLSGQATGQGLRSLAVLVAVPAVESVQGTTPEVDDAGLLAAVAYGYGAAEVLDPATLAVTPHAVAHPQFRAERELAMPPPESRGVTIFFTGLSGSGKSTVAKALADRLAERSPRTVSLLDGDEVRRLLSAGLTFSRADRDLNISRIGYVATEVSRHGGLAICAPIAPFAQARDQVRESVDAVGDFLLIHVSTPLAECERRDRKGLYAKARQGLIPDFTGISSPYEVPVDADLRLNTAEVAVSEAVDAIWVLLLARGYLTTF